MTAPEPTADEIARVEAWREERNRAAHLAYRARMEEREAKVRDELAEKLVGHTIAAVGGVVEDAEDWQTLILRLDNDATLTMRIVGWDEKKLEVTYDSSHAIEEDTDV